MSSPIPAPALVAAAWYRDPRDHRCPHDSWLEALEISEPARGERSEVRATAMRLRLLGAYHDGYIVFRYSGVESYSLAAPSSGQGLGDWLEDELRLDEDGLWVHRIHWSGRPSGQAAVWTIVAREVTYEWVPKSGETACPQT